MYQAIPPTAKPYLALVSLVMELGSVTHPSSELSSAAVDCRTRPLRLSAVPFWPVERPSNPRDALGLQRLAKPSFEDGRVTEFNSGHEGLREASALFCSRYEAWLRHAGGTDHRPGGHVSTNTNDRRSSTTTPGPSDLPANLACASLWPLSYVRVPNQS